MHDLLNCKSKNLFYLTAAIFAFNLVPPMYWSTLGRPSAISTNIGEHRRSILNYEYFPNPTLVSEHCNQADHCINDVLLIPLELIRSNRDSVRTAREAHLIDKAMTVEPHGINRRDEQ